MRYLAWAVAALCAYLGVERLVALVEGTTKYSDGATVAFAVVFLGTATGTLFFTSRGRPAGGALFGLTPLVLIVVVVFVTLMVSSWQ